MVERAAELLERQVWGNSLGSWAAALAVVVLGSLLLRVIVGYARRKAEARAEAAAAGATAQTATAGRLVAALLRRTRNAVLFLAALAAATLIVRLPGGLGAGIRLLLLLAAIVQAGLWASEVLAFGIRRVLMRHPSGEAATAMAAAGLIRLVGNVIVWAAVLLLCFDNLGVDVTAMIAGLGVGGIAIALAVQNVLGDLFASVSIVLDKPFAVGDTIAVGEFTGTVESVGLKTTRVRGLGGEQVIFPNADLLQSRLRNLKRMVERRSVFKIGIVYETPEEKVAAIPAMLREAVEEHGDEVRFDRAHFQSYGDFALLFEVVYFVLTPDYLRFMDIQQAINLSIFRRFAAAEIGFAYPTQTVLLGGAPATTAGGGSAAS